MKTSPRVAKTKAPAAPAATSAVTRHLTTATATPGQPPALLSEDAAAQAMWLYYRDHKQQLIADIRDYRAAILAQLMAGTAAEVVFAPYFRPAEPAKAQPAASGSRGTHRIKRRHSWQSA